MVLKQWFLVAPSQERRNLPGRYGIHQNSKIPKTKKMVFQAILSNFNFWNPPPHAPPSPPDLA